MPSPQPHHRTRHLARRQETKMAASAHAFVRGSTRSFYRWLEDASAKVPAGPSIWICGDCHLGNLGPVADTKHRVGVQVRDVDQTVIGNPAHDLVRLGLSLASVARGSNLPGTLIREMIDHLLEGYGRGLMYPAIDEIVSPPKEIRRALEVSVRRRWHHLARERLDDIRPTIPIGKRFWTLSAAERDELADLFQSEPVRQLLTALKARDNAAKIDVVDAAYWVKGCSSLGRLRYAVLADVGGELCLVDLKQATPAAAPRSVDASMPSDHAKRVVAGATALAPKLGKRMLATSLQNKPIVMRELMPQDLKLDIEHLAHAEALEIAAYLASVVGQAHGRQLPVSERTQWLRTLRPKKASNREPSWLWLAIVELLALHEAAYLEHCWSVTQNVHKR